jgi:outer membrane protein OmpA-like peptidoglycan-associated protein
MNQVYKLYKMNMSNFKTLTAVVISAGMLGGCAAFKDMSNQDKGVLIGAGSGAVAGGVIGKVAGKSPAVGAAIGTIVGGVAGGIIGNRMDKQAKEIEQTVPGAEVERVGEGIVINFSDKILFSTGKSDLGSQAYTAMDKLVLVLNKYDQTDVKIYGHTDNVGTEASNQTLSERRASAVSNYLASKNISRSRLNNYGFGESSAKCDNASAEGRACNRRVEFAITANAQMQAEAKQEAGN